MGSFIYFFAQGDIFFYKGANNVFSLYYTQTCEIANDWLIDNIIIHFSNKLTSLCVIYFHFFLCCIMGMSIDYIVAIYVLESIKPITCYSHSRPIHRSDMAFDWYGLLNFYDGQVVPNKTMPMYWNWEWKFGLVELYAFADIHKWKQTTQKYI